MLALLFPQFIHWFFIGKPLRILKGWRNILAYILEFFSIGALAKTLFSPWKGIRWQKQRGFDIGDYLSVIFSNLTSRFLGATVRLILIGMGLLTEFLLSLVAMISIIAWFALPFLIVLAIFYGFKAFILI